MSPPELIRPQLPDAFADFWHTAVAEAEAATLDFSVGNVLHPVPSGMGQTDPGIITSEHEIRGLSFRGIDAHSVRGWLTMPLTLSSPKVAGFLWLPPYGRESVMPNQYGTRRHYASLSFNHFGLDAFHEEKYSPNRGYFIQGVEQPKTWVFRRMFQNAVLASRVLAASPNVDGTRLASMGMSQGGGMSIWLGAWCDRIRAVCADMPFLGGMHETLLKNVYRYPLKELMDFVAGDAERESQMLRTISYFDTLNQATYCTKPTLVSVGLKDPAVKPIQARSIFEALPGEKHMVEYAGGHDWDPQMIENNRSWLDRWL